MNQLFAIEYNGEHWQSVFPSRWAEFSQNHATVVDAAKYIAETAARIGNEVNVPEEFTK